MRPLTPGRQWHWHDSCDSLYDSLMTAYLECLDMTHSRDQEAPETTRLDCVLMAATMIFMILRFVFTSRRYIKEISK